MDPEDLREVISAYQKCVAETVHRFGGFVAKYMGDGVLVYFGYPQAHEDDAERAVRAGLELVAAVGGLKTHAPLQTRVGIATGLVVVGDLIGSGASQEQAIVGETPNLAARLQGVAEPNSVVIAESTRKLVGNLFELSNFMPPSFHAGGLRFHGVAPLVSHLKELGLIEAVALPQKACFEAGVIFARGEGILPAPEANHSVRVAIDEALKCKKKARRVRSCSIYRAMVTSTCRLMRITSLASFRIRNWTKKRSTRLLLT